MEIIAYALELAADKLETESNQLIQRVAIRRLSGAKRVIAFKRAIRLLRKSEVIRIHRAFLNPKGITYV